ncbi:glycosyl-phosphatidylinositol-anchored molecule-like protein [Saccopteryx leptura]|uniref:glycosyl-phosphatidylinositol-anchored molecule-like protein n=1 Tax=Saccopteryx leptura TaxID=249018 RepID=UPI00339BF38C
MMLLCALLLAVGQAMGFAVVETNLTERAWTYNLKCHECAVVNSFSCSTIRTCLYEIRRCMVVSIRLNSRELLVYKNCTNNCTFVYEALMPPPAPKTLRTNSFYWVLCCGGMNCNEGGPTNLEKDIPGDQTFEENLEARAVRLPGSAFFLGSASVLVSRTLT